MNNSSMIQCPNCQTWNKRNAEFCTNCGSRLTAFAGEWWKEYNMVPVEFVKSKILSEYYLRVLLSIGLSVALGAATINKYMTSSESILFESLLFLAWCLISYFLSFVPLWRCRNDLKKLSYIEKLPAWAWKPPFLFCISGNYSSRKFGLFFNGKLILQPVYDSLKWQERGKTLLAVLNSVPMIIDVKGRRYE